jgi:hypothetical protein
MKYRSCAAPVVWILAVLFLAIPAFAQADDDDDKDEAPGVIPNPGMFTDDTFNQWIFQNQGTFADARKHLDLLLALIIDDIDRA